MKKNQGDGSLLPRSIEPSPYFHYFIIQETIAIALRAGINNMDTVDMGKEDTVDSSMDTDMV
ncbi:hypothetical protein ACQCT5_00570 [Sutcliffiella halmapala]